MLSTQSCMLITKSCMLLSNLHKPNAKNVSKYKASRWAFPHLIETMLKNVNCSTLLDHISRLGPHGWKKREGEVVEANSFSGISGNHRKLRSLSAIIGHSINYVRLLYCAMRMITLDDFSDLQKFPI